MFQMATARGMVFAEVFLPCGIMVSTRGGCELIILRIIEWSNDNNIIKMFNNVDIGIPR